MFFGGRESIFVKPGADVARRVVRKRILGEKIGDLRSVLEQTFQKTDERSVVPVIAERGEPHLPIEPRLVRRVPTRRPLQRAWLPLEFVRAPFGSVRAAF